MRKKFFVELFYNKDDSSEKGLSEIPNLDAYSSETIMLEVVSPDLDEAKKQILLKYPNTVYIYVHEVRSTDI